MLFGALDEMATNWVLSERKYDLASDADAVIDLFVTGTGRGRRASQDPPDAHCHDARLSLVCSGGRRPRATHLDGGRVGRRHHGRPDRRALRQRRRAGAAARPGREDRARGPGPRAQAEAGPAVRARRARADPHRRLRHRPRAHRRGRLDSRGRGRAPGHQARSAGAGRRRRGARDRSSARTRRASRSPRSPRAGPTTSAGTGWARTSSTRRATFGCSKIIPTPETDAGRHRGGALRLPTIGWAKASSSRRTRRTSSPTTSRSTA